MTTIHDLGMRYAALITDLVIATADYNRAHAHLPPMGILFARRGHPEHAVAAVEAEPGIQVLTSGVLRLLAVDDLVMVAENHGCDPGGFQRARPDGIAFLLLDTEGQLAMCLGLRQAPPPRRGPKRPPANRGLRRSA